MRTKVRAATAIGLNVVNRVGWYFGMRPIITRSPKDKEPRQAIVLPRLKLRMQWRAHASQVRL